MSKDDERIIGEHFSRLQALRDKGLLILAGPNDPPTLGPPSCSRRRISPRQRRSRNPIRRYGPVFSRWTMRRRSRWRSSGRRPMSATSSPTRPTASCIARSRSSEPRSGLAGLDDQPRLHRLRRGRQRHRAAGRRQVRDLLESRQGSAGARVGRDAHPQLHAAAHAELRMERATAIRCVAPATDLDRDRDDRSRPPGW